MKTVGIIGGLGPETTAEFYLELVFGCYKKNKEQRPPILIWSIPLEYKIEEELLTKSLGEERYIPYLIEAAQKLEKADADFLVMPCNSLHIFIDRIRESVKIPVLSIVEETVSFLKKNNINKVGIVATSTSLQRRLYDDLLEKNKIELITPNNFEQAKMGKIINNIVTNRHTNKDREEIINIINNFDKKEIKNIILACTDLQLLIPHHPNIAIYDTMKVFAEATVDEILKD